MWITMVRPRGDPRHRDTHDPVSWTANRWVARGAEDLVELVAGAGGAAPRQLHASDVWPA